MDAFAIVFVVGILSTNLLISMQRPSVLTDRSSVGVFLLVYREWRGVLCSVESSSAVQRRSAAACMDRIGLHLS